MDSKKILVIEDHDGLRLIEGMYLNKHYAVVTKRDGLEGIIWMRGGNIPDLIVLDLMMPRLNGIEFIVNLKSSGFYRHIPVVVVSSDEDREIIDHCYNLGVTHYLTKPFSPKILLEKINKVFSEGNRARMR